MGIKILLTGKKFSGKTTVANYIKEKYNFKEYTFAEPLKEICRQVFHLSDSQLHDQEQKETIDNRWGITPRQMFQNMGDLMREQMPNYFNIPTEPKIFTQILENKLKGIDQNIIISDGRLPDEIKWFRSLEYPNPNISNKEFNNTQTTGEKFNVVIKIKRDGLKSYDTHITERYEYDCDIVLQNNGTIQELYKSIDEIMKKIQNFG